MAATFFQIEPFITQYGLLAIFLLVALESLGLPLPGETVLILGAGLASGGALNVYAVAAVAIVAAVLGDNIGYLLGRSFGRPVILRFGSRIGITSAAFSRAERVMCRRGAIIVVIARFVMLLRQLNGLVAGTTRMRWWTFLAANTVGAVLWVVMWVVLAFNLGREVSLVPLLWHHLGMLAKLLIPVTIVVFIVIYFKTRAKP